MTTLIIFAVVALLIIAVSQMVVGDTSVTGGTVQASVFKGNGCQPNFGHATVAMADANTTAAVADYECFQIKLTGTLTAGRNYVLPLVAGAVHNIWNSGTGQAVTVIGSTGTGTAIANNKSALVQCDGTNWNRMTADVTP